MYDFFKKMLRNQVIMAVVSIVFGVVLIGWRSGAVAGIIRILGILLLIASVIALVSYFVGNANKGNPSTLAAAILGILVSLIFIYTPGWLISMFPVLMGIVLIVSSVFNISSLLSSPVRSGMFPFGMLLSVLTLILGIVAVVNPWAVANTLILFIGITYLINGINDLVAVAMLGK